MSITQRAEQDQPYLSNQLVVDEAAPLPVGLAGHASGVVGGQVVVVGGTHWNEGATEKLWSKRTFIFDGSRWSEGATLPVAIAYAGYAHDASGLYIAGGNDGTADQRSFSRLTTNAKGDVELYAMQPLPAPVHGGGGVIIDGTFYIVAGYVEGRESTQFLSLDLLDPGARWQTLAGLPGSPRAYAGVASTDDALYVVGGYRETSAETFDVVRDVWRYRIRDRAWTCLGELPAPGYGWVAGGVDAHHLLLAGRCDRWIYDDIWLVHLPDLAVRRVGRCASPMSAGSLVHDGSAWYVAGGEPDARRRVRSDKVTRIALPPSPRR